MTLEPSRIVLARLRAGMSKAELARRLRVTSRTITNYESLGAPVRIASALADATGCRVEFFSLPPAEPLEADQVFFRARRRSTASQKHSATSAGRTGVELYALITEHFALPELTVPDLAGLDPVAAAQQLRAEWQLGTDPLPNLVRLAEAHGIRVLTLPHGTEDVDAFSLWENKGPYVFLSTMKTSERSRFDLAHEIGHLALHAGLPNSTDGERNAEKEADQFASEFLMPRVLLRSRVPREPSIDTILSVKVHLGVSALAATYALHKAGLMSEWGYRQACVELTRRGYRSSEPEGMPRETSRVFQTVLPALRKSKGWSVDRIARSLGVSATEVHGLTFGQALADIVPHEDATRSSGHSRAHLTVVAPSMPPATNESFRSTLKA